MSSLDLEQAQELILTHCQVGRSHEQSLLDAAGRVCVRAVQAAMAIPHFRQSAMDGFALQRQDLQPEKSLPIKGEVAAGTTQAPSLQPGTALRIMTGGMVPDWCDLVVPFELCEENNGQLQVVEIPDRSHIREQGADVELGQEIIAAGETISPGHMHLAATAGIEQVQVARRPRIAILCTGSELVTSKPLPGQLISGNLFLLSGLINQAGGKVVSASTVADDPELIATELAGLADVDMLITTGGMGPGKYDLVAQALARAGVEIFYQQLRLRPGKSTLFGRRQQTLFFGLPGPPPAVRLLFHELVRPAILALQGSNNPRPPVLQARLTEELAIRQRGILNLKGGILRLEDGNALVRPADRHESASCLVLVPAERRCLKKGELVTIHLTDSGFSQ